MGLEREREEMEDASLGKKGGAFEVPAILQWVWIDPRQDSTRGWTLIDHLCDKADGYSSLRNLMVILLLLYVFVYGDARYPTIVAAAEETEVYIVG